MQRNPQNHGDEPVAGNGVIVQADADTAPRRPNSIDALVGDRVRVRRLVLGMSQERLAEELDLTFQQIQKYEKGINRICASRLFDLSKALGVPVQYFFEEVAHHPPGNNDLGDTATEAQIFLYLRSPEGLALNRAFLRVSNAKRRGAIIALVRSLAELRDDHEAAKLR